MFLFTKHSKWIQTGDISSTSSILPHSLQFTRHSHPIMFFDDKYSAFTVKLNATVTSRLPAGTATM
jgi:hypothetical protein